MKTVDGETKYPEVRIQSKDKVTQCRTKRQRVSFRQGEEEGISVRNKIKLTLAVKRAKHSHSMSKGPIAPEGCGEEGQSETKLSAGHRGHSEREVKQQHAEQW